MTTTQPMQAPSHKRAFSKGWTGGLKPPIALSLAYSSGELTQDSVGPLKRTPSWVKVLLISPRMYSASLSVFPSSPHCISDLLSSSRQKVFLSQDLEKKKTHSLERASWPCLKPHLPGVLSFLTKVRIRFKGRTALWVFIVGTAHLSTMPGMWYWVYETKPWLPHLLLCYL